VTNIHRQLYAIRYRHTCLLLASANRLSLSGAPVTVHPTSLTTPPDATSSLFTLFQSHIPIFQQVPKGARDLWAKALGHCLSSVTNNSNDLVLWAKLFIPRCVLVRPAAGHHLPWRDILWEVKSHWRRWATGDYTALWSEA
jgi:hypothetical protein